MTRRRQIRDGELRLRPLGAGQRRTAGRAGHGVDEGIHDPVRVAEIGVDVFAFDGKGSVLPEAVDADRGETLLDLQEIRGVASDVAGKADVAGQRRAVANSPGAGPY